LGDFSIIFSMRAALTIAFALQCMNVECKYIQTKRESNELARFLLALNPRASSRGHSLFTASPTNVLAKMMADQGRSTDSGVDTLHSKFGLPLEDSEMDRRSAIGLGVSAAASAALFGKVQPAAAQEGMFSLPPLPYAYDALEPHIDASTMKFHHDFHHQAYINNLNKAMAGKDAASLVSLMPGAKAAKLNNAGGGHYNHCLFWNVMGPNGGGEPAGVLGEKVTAAFGSYDEFKEKFAAAAAGVFGSGWAWLAVDKAGGVKIVTTPNQDNPLMDGATEAGLIPILGIDVWEHAYYLKYQNRRPEYISAWFNVINWEKVGEYYATASSGKPIEF
jgi:Fe-Mn family superoxide dismutase